MQNNYRVHYDEHATCPKCTRSWQLLDFGCALHRLSCGDVQIPQSERDRITASAEAHGVQIRWS